MLSTTLTLAGCCVSFVLPGSMMYVSLLPSTDNGTGLLLLQNVMGHMLG